jgi:hypothetical protein
MRIVDINYLKYEVLEWGLVRGRRSGVRRKGEPGGARDAARERH